MKILQINLSCTRDIQDRNLTETAFSLYILRSPAVISINGNQYAVSGSTALILTSDCKKSFRSPSKRNLRFDCINFRPSSSDKQYMSSLRLPVNTPVKIRDDIAVISSVRAMKTNFIRQGQAINELMELYMKIIFILISESYKTASEKNISATPHYYELKILRGSIYENPARKWNSESICQEIGISRTYFHRLYQEAFGTTFLRDVIESRLSFGCELLISTDLSISEIAEKAGYENDSFFMRQFKKYKACTPSEYRKQTADHSNNKNIKET